MKWIKEHICFTIIFLCCIVLRLLPLFNYQFTYDELSALDRTQFTNFPDLLSKGISIDAHPALIQVFLFLMVKSFGYTEWIIKLPFLFFGFASLWIGYIFCLRNFSKQTGIFFSLFMAFSLPFVFYSPIARMYISGVFFSLGLLFFFYEIFFQNNLHRTNFIWLGIFFLLCSLNHHINSLYAFSIALSGLFFLNQENKKPYLITCLLVVIFYLPHLSITMHQLGLSGIGAEQGGWLDNPYWYAGFEFLKYILGTGYVYLVVILIFFFSAFNSGWRKPSARKNLLLALFITNYFIVYFYSIFRAPIYQHTVMLFSGSGLLVFFSSMLEFKNSKMFGFSFYLLLSTLVFTSYFQKNYFKQSVRTCYDTQFERTIYLKNKFGKENVYPIFFETDTFVRKNYFNKYGEKFECRISGDSDLFEKNYERFIASLKQNYLIISAGMPVHWAIAGKHFPFLFESLQTQGMNIKVFSKEKTDDHDFITLKELLNSSSFQWQDKFVYSAKSLKSLIDSSNEFPFEAESKYSDVFSKQGQMLLCYCKIKLEKGDYRKTEICISITDENTKMNYGYTASEASNFIVNSDSTVELFVNYFAGNNFNEIRNSSRLSCYIWNKGKSSFRIIDFKIKTIDYWNQKWNFWN